MVRLLVVQPLYNLSDDALEYQVLDRASFQHFAGLSHSGRVPDAKTFWVGRERLKQQGSIETVSQAVSEPLDRARFIARGGQIIGASMVTAPVQHNHHAEDDTPKRSEGPQDWSPAKPAHKDTEARWTQKHGKRYDGYKLHINTDRRRGFIRVAQVTTAGSTIPRWSSDPRSDQYVPGRVRRSRLRQTFAGTRPARPRLS